MIDRRRFLGGAVALAGGLVLPPLTCAATAKVGAAAPAFSLPSSSGPTVSLADHRGKTVVLEWTNHDCPYVRKHYDTQNMQGCRRKRRGRASCGSRSSPPRRARRAT